MAILEELSENLMKGKANEVKELTQKAIDEGVSPEDILNQGMLSAMGIIGERFKKNEIYVPEMLIAARAMKMGMEVLQPKLTATGVEPIGTATSTEPVPNGETTFRAV